jgi:shikimate dehydrogenase
MLDELENLKNSIFEGKKIIFGLIGNPGIKEYSFSKKFFTDFFKEKGYSNCTYLNFGTNHISDLPKLFDFFKEEKDKFIFGGLNVTNPYKGAIKKYVTSLSPAAESIGAVNTLKIDKDGKLIGHNTDYIGFTESIKPFLNKGHKKALILGTGGASKAVAYAFAEMGIENTFVSRVPKNTTILSYEQLSESVMNEYQIIVNCTHLGTHPNEDEKPNIPYSFISNQHLLYDLIYNPGKTQFLATGEKKGAAIKNGLEMLKLQALESWNIWDFEQSEELKITNQ